jgi:hypothetical protein
MARTRALRMATRWRVRGWWCRRRGWGCQSAASCLGRWVGGRGMAALGLWDASLPGMDGWPTWDGSGRGTKARASQCEWARTCRSQQVTCARTQNTLGCVKAGALQGEPAVPRGYLNDGSPRSQPVSVRCLALSAGTISRVSSGVTQTVQSIIGVCSHRPLPTGSCASVVRKMVLASDLQRHGDLSDSARMLMSQTRTVCGHAESWW